MEVSLIPAIGTHQGPAAGADHIAAVVLTSLAALFAMSPEELLPRILAPSLATKAGAVTRDEAGAIIRYENPARSAVALMTPAPFPVRSNVPPFVTHDFE